MYLGLKRVLIHQINYMFERFILFLFISLFAHYNIAQSNDVSACVQLIENNQIKKAEKCINSLLETQESSKDKSKIYLSVSRAYNANLYYSISLNYAFEGIKNAPPESYLLKELLEVVITNHIDLKNYDLAESYYWKTSKIESEQANIIANQFNLIAEIYRLKGAFKKSLPYFHKAISINKNNSFNGALAINYNNIALSQLYLDQIDSAQYYLDASNKIIEDLGLTYRKSTIHTSYGQLYLKQGSFSQALSSFQKTMTFDLSNHPDKSEVYRDSYKGMMKCYKLLGDYENALKYYVKYQDYKTQILDSKKNTEILQNQILSDRENHSIELKLINDKLALENKNRKITYIIFGTIFLIIILFVYILWIRNKRVKQKVELEVNKNRIQELEIDQMKLSQKQLESELIQTRQSQEIKNLEQTRLEEQIQFKNRELTSTAIHLMSKNELLSQIKDKIEQIENVNEDARPKIYKEINFLISDSLRLDEDWQVFKKHFTDVHPHFFNQLKKEYSDLTTDELKLCAYLKIQLSSKEIARLINVTVAAVNKRRNRLRKKLDISADEDFHDFFQRNL
jgi:tetratricopeptide (TPR) repeat protein